jgi:hypothetical protein
MVYFRNFAVFTACAALMLAFVSVADAASTSSRRGRSTEITGRQGNAEMILNGPVVSVSPATGFLVMRHGSGQSAEEIPVEIDSRTTLTRGGSRVSIDEVKVGDRLRVRYSGSPGDVTKTVEVVSGPSMRSGRGSGRM